MLSSWRIEMNACETRQTGCLGGDFQNILIAGQNVWFPSDGKRYIRHVGDVVTVYEILKNSMERNGLSM